MSKPEMFVINARQVTADDLYELAKIAGCVKEGE